MNTKDVFATILAMIIDFHTHVFSPKIKNNRDKCAGTDPCFDILYATENAKIATAEELIASMDEAGVDVSVITNIGWATHETCVTTNDYILESIARYPDRLVGFATVLPQAGEAAFAEVERCARAGIKGIGEIRPDTQSIDLTSDAMASFVEILCQHNLILLTHASEPVGHNYPGKGSITPEILYPFVTRFPELTIVLAHWGGGLPFYALMPEVKMALENVYFDTAASPFLYQPQIYNHAIHLIGAEKILFGSDCPLMSPTRLINEIRTLSLPEETVNLILSGNALRLLGLDKV
ncbi:amidohydrolase family protein [Chloroflexota bacterium]